MGLDYEQVHSDVFFGKKLIWLLFDDAQDTYWDISLWNDLFKQVISNGRSSRVRIVCFVSYGRPFNRHTSHGTPERIPAEACMELFPTKHVDHALLFTKAEFDEFMEQCDELVRKGTGDAFYWPMLDDDLKKYVFTTSNGHIGAITGLLNLAATATASSLIC